MIRVSTIYRDDEQPVSWVRLVVVSLLGAGLVALIYAHFHIAGSDTYAGLLAPLGRIFDFVLAIAITVMLAALGLTVSRILNISWTNTAETLSISLFLGTGVFSLAVLGLGLRAGQRLHSSASSISNPSTPAKMATGSIGRYNCCEILALGSANRLASEGYPDNCSHSFILFKVE